MWVCNLDNKIYESFKMMVSSEIGKYYKRARATKVKHFTAAMRMAVKNLLIHLNRTDLSGSTQLSFTCPFQENIALPLTLCRRPQLRALQRGSCGEIARLMGLLNSCKG